MKKATLVLIVMLLLAGCAQDRATKDPGFKDVKGVNNEVVKMESAGKKILMIIAPEGFRDEEFSEPKEVFESEGFEVTVASKGARIAKGKLGSTADVDMDISEADVDDFDAVVFVGGPGAAVYFDDPVAHRIAKDAFIRGKVVAAICIAPSILANAGVLEGRKATSFESESGNINAKSGGYTGESVTVDGKVVTANGPGAATKFGKEIVKLLQ